MKKHDITVEMFLDPACPWCYMGYRQLLAAAETVRDGREEDVAIRLQWRPLISAQEIPRTGLVRVCLCLSLPVIAYLHECFNEQ